MCGRFAVGSCAKMGSDRASGYPARKSARTNFKFLVEWMAAERIPNRPDDHPANYCRNLLGVVPSTVCHTVCPPLAPCWPAGFFSVLAGSCQFGTAWAGLRLIHYQHHHRNLLDVKISERGGGEEFAATQPAEYVRGCYAEASAMAGEHAPGPPDPRQFSRKADRERARFVRPLYSDMPRDMPTTRGSSTTPPEPSRPEPQGATQAHPRSKFLISGPREFVLRKPRGRLRLVNLSRTPSGTFFV